MDKLNVEYSEFRVENTKIEIYSLNGGKCLEKSIPAGMQDNKLDVSSFESGLYFCKVSFHDSCV